MLGAGFNNIDQLLEIYALYIFQRKLSSGCNEDIRGAPFQEGIDRGAASRVEGQDEEGQAVECTGEAGDDIFNVVSKVNCDPFCARGVADVRAEGLNVLGQIIC